MQKAFSPSFCSSAAFSAYRNSFNKKSDEDAYIFIGVVCYAKTSFKMLIRSQYGKGSNFMFNIIEFTGQYCYIPTGENCFIKCVNKIIADKILNMSKRSPTALQDSLKLNLTYYDKSKPNNTRAS